MIDIRQLPNLNIEQKNLLNRFYDQFNFASAGSGLNRHFANVEPLLFEGLIFGSEFLIYAVTKLYLCFSINFGSSTIVDANRAFISFYNENDLIRMYTTINSIAYQSVAAVIWYEKNNTEMNNLWFSRLTNAEYTSMKFIGYRITLD